MAPTYTLHYFNSMGRAELSRLILAQAGVEYDDHRIEKEQWPEMKQNMPFGQLPVLEVDGVYVAESRAISRFLAREHGLSGKNSLESARCDMIVDALYDVLAIAIKILFVQDPKTKEEMKEQFHKENFPPFARNVEKLLIRNGKGHIVGDSVTWADIALAHAMSAFEEKRPELLKDYENLREHHQKIMNLPNIKKWIEERPKTPF